MIGSTLSLARAGQEPIGSLQLTLSAKKTLTQSISQRDSILISHQERVYHST